MFRGANDGGDGELAGMSEADIDAPETDLLGALRGEAVQVDDGFAATVREDLDLSPGEAAGAGAKRLHHGFLRGEAGGQFRDATAAESHLLPRVDAAEEALRVPLEHATDARDLDGIDADGVLHRPIVRTARAVAVSALVEQRAVDFGRPPSTLEFGMSATIIDGAAIARDLLDELRREIDELKRHDVQPGLAFVLVGENPASISYVRGKAKDAEATGVRSETIRLAEDISQEQLIGVVAELNADPRWHGMLVQMPLPPQLDESAVAGAVLPEKDVDGLHPVNVGRLFRGEPGFRPCTPYGVVQMLMRSGHDPAGQHVVVCGRSNLVGKPVAGLLMQKARGANATVTVCHTGTRDIGRYTRRADIIVAAMGRPKAITGEMVREGAVVIDVGVNRVDDATKKAGYRLVGDADFEAVAEKASAITPVPGGVGPMTRAMLMYNTVLAAKGGPGAE